MKLAPRTKPSSIIQNESPVTPLPFDYSADQLDLRTYQLPDQGSNTWTAKFWTRVRSYDAGTLRENLSEKCYLSRIHLSPRDRWLDAGGHIGAFSISVSQQVACVHTFEPFPGSFSLLRKNISQNGINNVYPQNVALSHDNADYLTLNLNPRGSHGVHSVLPLHGRRPLRVPCVNIDDQIRLHSLNCIKMDVEGAESTLLPGISDESWKSIDQLVMEYHFSYLKDADQSQYAALIELVSHYLPHLVSSLPENAERTPKTCIIYASKDKSNA